VWNGIFISFYFNQFNWILEAWMTANGEISNQKKQKSQASRTGFGLKVIFLLLTAILGLFLGVGIYLGITNGLPALKAQFLAPVQENQTEIQKLQTQIEGTLTAYQDEFAEIEQLQLLRETEQAEAVLTQIPVEKTMAANRSEIQTLGTAVARQKENIQKNSTSQQSQSEELNSLANVVSYLATAQAASAGLSSDVLTIRIQIRLLNAYQFILDNNYGKAEGEIESIIIGLSTAAADDPRWNETLSLLENAQKDLPESPDLALSRLNLAFETIESNLPPINLSRTPTPPSPTPYLTPTAELTVPPTITPTAAP
jgi:hypothetical protein